MGQYYYVIEHPVSRIPKSMLYPPLTKQKLRKSIDDTTSSLLNPGQIFYIEIKTKTITYSLIHYVVISNIILFKSRSVFFYIKFLDKNLIFTEPI